MKKAITALVICFGVVVYTIVTLPTVLEVKNGYVGLLEIWAVVILITFFSVRTILRKTREVKK